MSSIVAPARSERSRPTAVTVAALLAVFIQLASIPFYFVPGADEMPGVVIVIGTVFGLLTLLGAWGMWRLLRWGAILTFVVTLLNVVSSIPGYFDPPSGWISLELWTLGPLSLAVLVLLIWFSTFSWGLIEARR